ncbi:TniB family NTP-binding protein [Streptomyces sp. NPDC000927]|uniref:TniB family NTP-binding protein n=1 Tax=Streptomyces sp. NPDC000927 TaxID=3154371 RepID=UPI00333432B4
MQGHDGRACQLAHIHSHPAPAGTTHTAEPVAYVLVPARATAKALAAEFARYLGVPVTRRATQAQITDAVCHTHDKAGVRLVLIDEIHRLNPRTATGAETADLLKDLTERIQAAFVYADIDVLTTALFSDVRGARLAARASPVECGAFPARLGEHEPFKELITTRQAALDLRAHRPGTLPRHASRLHQRTAGRIGSPTRLLRRASITTMLDDSERITKTSLDRIHTTRPWSRPNTVLRSSPRSAHPVRAYGKCRPG